MTLESSFTAGLLKALPARRLAVRVLAATALSCTMGVCASPALAAEEGAPQWTVDAVSQPTVLTPGDETGDQAFVVRITNTGGAASNGEPITVTDELPASLSFSSIPASGEDELAASKGEKGAKMTCLLSSCTYSGTVVADDTLVVRFPVDVPLDAPSSVENSVHVSGGGALPTGRETETTISTTQASFGISPGGSSTALSSLQAGAHPDLTTAIAFNTVKSGGLAGDPKDTTDDLPPGFAGDLVDTPACTSSEFLQGECPIGAQIGITTLTLTETGVDKGPQIEPVYNLSPGPGDAAKIGFAFGGVLFFEGDITVRPGDYGLEATFHNATEGSVELENVSLTVWGVPAAPIHDSLRWKPGEQGARAVGSFGVSSDAPVAPYLSNPTGCGAQPLEAVFSVTSWEQPNEAVHAHMPFGPFVGCDRLGMEPKLTAEATTDNAYSPTGLNLTMAIPQTYENPEGRATSTLNRAVVTLPEGMTVNPSAGAGLGACTEAQYEEEGVQFVAGTGCPSDSKLGTVKISTPSLSEEATGTVYLAQPYSNPFGSLLALYIVARIPNRGVLVKTAGEVHADETTGRLVTTFDNLPPLPFNLFTFRFNQGATSPLVTPPTCGSYTVGAALTPLSNLAEVLNPEIPAFSISHGVDGGQCPAGGVPPFAPQLSAGTVNNNAGSYSAMDIRITRNDGEQEITRFSSELPPGLTANLTNVPFCPDADIEASKGVSGAQEEAEPSCPQASLIGDTLVGAGVGSVLVYVPGKVYMAGPYNGAPFSIVAITSAKVGPFDLGTVVVREALRINPTTGVVSVDATASDPIPHIIKGIVVHVRDIRVSIDRPNFTLNPTSCSRMAFSATISGDGAEITNPADDSHVTVEQPFQAADCQALAFRPKFTATTSGRTSKTAGASLSVKLTYPSAPQGSQANISYTKVDLPLQLPSRLSTLQKACLASTFAANPASCPPASVVGHATAVTPILPVPLTGPAYFVSHGGAKFPELVVVLQGYGVTIELNGETFISKAGITSSTFRTIPDQPVSSFELTLPEGSNSALAAYGNLCAPTRAVTVRKVVLVKSNGHTKRVTRKLTKAVATTLQMPTEFIAQNGLTIRQSTPIAATGCLKHAVKKPAKRSAGKKGAHAKKK